MCSAETHPSLCSDATGNPATPVCEPAYPPGVAGLMSPAWGEFPLQEFPLRQMRLLPAETYLDDFVLVDHPRKETANLRFRPVCCLNDVGRC